MVQGLGIPHVQTTLLEKVPGISHVEISQFAVVAHPKETLELENIPI